MGAGAGWVYGSGVNSGIATGSGSGRIHNGYIELGGKRDEWSKVTLLRVEWRFWQNWCFQNYGIKPALGLMVKR